MKENLKLKMKGELKLFDKNGKTLKHWKNTIVDNASYVIAQCIGGGKTINKIKFGAWDVSAPQPTTTGMEDVESDDTYLLTLNESSYPSDTEVTFNFTIPDNVFQNKYIKEYALFSDSQMFSRIARTIREDDFYKDVDTEVNGSWTIKIEKVYAIDQ